MRVWERIGACRWCGLLRNASERAGGCGIGNVLVSVLKRASGAGLGTHRSAQVVRVWERIGARRWCGFGNASERTDNAEPDKAPETSSVGMSKDKQQCDEAQ